MSNERLDRLEASIKRISKEVVLHGERLDSLERDAKKLDKLGELDQRVGDFVGDVEAARRDRKLGDLDFKENRDRLQDHEARLLKLERDKR